MSLDAFSQAFASTDWDKLAAAARPVPAAAPAATARVRNGLAAGDAAKPAAKGKKADDDGFLTFSDVIDIINPLQHIPLAASEFREQFPEQAFGPAARDRAASLVRSKATPLTR